MEFGTWNLKLSVLTSFRRRNFDDADVAHQFAVDLASQGRLGQPCPDGRSNFGHGDRAGELALGAVGKRDVEHPG